MTDSIYFDDLEEDHNEGFINEALEVFAQPDEVNRIFRLLNNRYPRIFVELQQYRVPGPIINNLFRYVIGFTIDNADNYTGTLEQKTNALLRSFLQQNPFVLFITLTYGVPRNLMRNIIRIIISFTLSQISTPPGGIFPPVREIVDAIARQTDVIQDLQNYNIPYRQARAIVRTIVAFTLRNSNPNRPPRNIQERATDLYNQLLRSNLDVIADMRAAGIPQGQIRAIVRTVIIFTLRYIY